MITQSFTWHLVTSLVKNLWGLIKNSLIFNLLMSFSAWITKVVTESGIYNWLGKDVFIEKYCRTSVFFGAFESLWKLLLGLIRKIQLFTRKIFKDSICLNVFDCLEKKGVFSIDVFLALFVGLMFLMPHERWNNLYAFLAACFFAFWAVMNIASGKLKGKSISKIGLAICVFVVAIGVSVLTAYVVSDAIRIALFLIASILLCYSVYVSIDSREKLVRFVKIVLFFVSLTALYGIAQRIMGVEVDLEFVDITANEGMPGRVYSTFSNPNNFAELLVLFMPFFVPLFFSVKTKLEKLVVLGGFGAVLGALAMTYSRSCWVGFALCAVIFVLIYDKRLIVPLAFLAVCAIPFLPSTIMNRIFTIGSMNDSSNSYRIYIWESCLNIIRDFGVTGIGLGPASFRCVYPGYSSPVAVTAPHSHMLYMEIIIEMGILGALGFFGYIFGVVKKTAGAMRKMDENLKLYGAAGISALGGIAFVCCAEYIWFYPRVMFAFWIVPGLLMAIVRLANKSE